MCYSKEWLKEKVKKKKKFFSKKYSKLKVFSAYLQENEASGVFCKVPVISHMLPPEQNAETSKEMRTKTYLYHCFPI